MPVGSYLHGNGPTPFKALDCTTDPGQGAGQHQPVFSVLQIKGEPAVRSGEICTAWVEALPGLGSIHRAKM